MPRSFRWWLRRRLYRMLVPYAARDRVARLRGWRWGKLCREFSLRVETVWAAAIVENAMEDMELTRRFDV